ncbi:MAG: hypothetical protein RIS94_2085, partial [Pseudomonadota bacterium]
MASISPGRRSGGADWRAILRRSFRRSAELLGGAALFVLMVFLALALVSYTQTDPSGSTASGSPVENWMGLPGAWASERLLVLCNRVADRVGQKFPDVLFGMLAFGRDGSFTIDRADQL